MCNQYPLHLKGDFIRVGRGLLLYFFNLGLRGLKAYNNVISVDWSHLSFALMNTGIFVKIQNIDIIFTTDTRGRTLQIVFFWKEVKPNDADNWYLIITRVHSKSRSS